MTTMGHESVSRRMRASMPVTGQWAYFDHAAVSPLPEPVRKAMAAWVQAAADQGDTVWGEWMTQVEATRSRAATLFGADTTEVALVPNTTWGVNLVAHGYPWEPGDNVVTLDNEFPTNVYPWLQLADQGVELRRVPTERGVVDLHRLAETCDRRTRIVTVSWVGFASGWRIDVPEVARLAHDRGALLFLDAIQGLGLFPLDVHAAGVDFLAADGHKWLLGPEGAGIFYIARKHLDRLRPLGIGWNSASRPFDYDRIQESLRPDARRFEGGSYNMIGLAGLGASLQWLLELGLTKQESPLASAVLEFNHQARNALGAIGAHMISHAEEQHRSGILCFEIPGRDPQQLRRDCLKAGVALSCRGGGLRISPHAYNNQDDLDRLLIALTEKHE